MSLLHELLDGTAQRCARNVALRCRGASLNYGELALRTRRIAAALSAAGVRRGDRVAMYLQNRPEVVELAFACSRLGALFVPVNPMLRARQLEHIVEDAGAAVLVASATTATSFRHLTESCPSLRLLVLCDSPASEASSSKCPTTAYETLLQGDTHVAGSGTLDTDPAALLYTSGSTGRPKGVILSHRNLVSGAQIVSGYLGNTEEDRLLAALPLSFDYGLSQVTSAFNVGACAVLTSYSLISALVQEVAAEGITGLAGVPTMWMQLAAAEWPDGALSKLRYITNSGGALPGAVLASLQARLPSTRIFCMYGLTEAFRSTYLDPAQLQSRPGSIGKAIPGQEVLVVRPDGTRCDPGEVGELVHRGSLVTLGYWNDPQLTAQRFRPWRASSHAPSTELAVWSGDLAKTDADGYIYFIGRADHLIKSSGYRISPSEIEEAAAEVPEVVESAAIGFPDDLLGQRVVLAVVLKTSDGVTELAEKTRQHCRMQLPAYMAPGEIYVLACLPRNANGKCDRGALSSLLLRHEAGDASDGAVRYVLKRK